MEWEEFCRRVDVKKLREADDQEFERLLREGFPEFREFPGIISIVQRYVPELLSLRKRCGNG
jgi:hypothetical protein